MEMTNQAYTVVDVERVQDALGLETAPVGLFVQKQQNKNACTVKIRPPTPNQEEISVSDTLLEELFEEGAIQLKEE